MSQAYAEVPLVEQPAEALLLHASPFSEIEKVSRGCELLPDHRVGLGEK